MKRIKCQREHDGTGCGTCGGYGYILEQCECPTCGTKYWSRPIRGMTVYDGKQFYSADGLLITVRFDKPWTCAKCVI